MFLSLRSKNKHAKLWLRMRSSTVRRHCGTWALASAASVNFASKGSFHRDEPQ
ncbi:hypothetical protein CERSUDRAFT_84214 [Gelatoporia subvermispora B]|uniref:Uncharacterized protein n=1 Tax=Ceriporiopsis subvermispora (strain B) TaxID=914234 RepID=M2QYE8_CERS8|nr:hypothetical protein CERSUDRAFT_84214 [Gelatoporia subvermispora B]